MKIENFEEAKEIKTQIDFLENKIKTFDPSQRWVYLRIYDHYGNNLHQTIETYSFSSDYTNAAGYGFDDIVSRAYSKFLSDVQEAMQQRIDMLKEQFESL